MDTNNSSSSAFKKQLAMVFDDNMRTKTKRWNNYLDVFIIVMIVLSTVSVFLTTFPISVTLQQALKVFDWIVQVFFVIEVSLRIWVADEIDPKYKGFLGRVRYCFSFYGLIDFLATYPVLLGMACPSLLMSSKVLQIFRVLRIARLFRVFHYMPSFRFLGVAIDSKKKEILVSFQFLAVITIVLSFILFLLEHDKNPEMLGNGWRSIVWSFAKYIGDPGLIVDEPVVTTGGKIISFLVGILGIAIFAVPIGLLSSGFSEAIEQAQRTTELKDFRQRLTKAFHRSGNKSLREYLESLPDKGGDGFKTLNIVPQNIPVSKLQVRQGLKMDDIIETCNEFGEFRIKNLTVALGDEELAADRFVVEHFPLNRKYGCYLPRQSKVTVVCTTSWDEVGIGWFAYYIAKMGGFNYISKEVEADMSEPDSFFNLTPQKPEEQSENRKSFIEDLNKVVAETNWVIIIAEHLKTSTNPTDFHFADAKKGGTDSTVNDQEVYQHFIVCFSDAMKEEFGLSTMSRSPRYPLLKKNLGYAIREKHKNVNVFVLRPSSELMNFNTRKLAIAYRMAQLISEQLDGGRGMTDTDMADLKKGGFGYKENEEMNDGD